MNNNDIHKDDFLTEMAEALSKLITIFDYRTQTMYSFAKQDIDYARNILSNYQQQTNSKKKALSAKTLDDIMMELESDFDNDFQAMCDNYAHSETSMLGLIDKKLTDGSYIKLSDVQKTLLFGLNLLILFFTTNNYYKYLGYIINPKFDDAHRKNLLYPIFNEKAADKITDECNDWKVRACKIIMFATGANDGDIESFVDNEWSWESSDMDNLELFLFAMQYSACEQVDEIESLEGKHIKDGTNVYWKDPAGETSGYYKVDGDFEPYDDCEVDDRIIEISSLFGSQPQVYPCELFVPKGI